MFISATATEAKNRYPPEMIERAGTNGVSEDVETAIQPVATQADQWRSFLYHRLVISCMICS
jgi:hypothetical protein